MEIDMNKKIQTFWDMAPEQLSGVKLKNMRNIHLDGHVPASDVNPTPYNFEV